jgi:hypothetical protein
VPIGSPFQSCSGPTARLESRHLRHACVSTWLNGGVAPAQVAEWAGHSVAVLLRVYAKCIDGQDQIAKRRIEEALRESDDGSATGNDRGTAETATMPTALGATSASVPADGQLADVNSWAGEEVRPAVEAVERRRTPTQPLDHRNSVAR